MLLALFVLLVPHAADAQNRRGPKTIIRKGQMIKPDTMVRGSGTLALEADSLLFGNGRRTVDNTGHFVTPAGIVAALDSTDRLLYVSDTLALDSLGLRPAVVAPPPGTIAAIDSASRLIYVADSVATDSLGLQATFVADSVGGDSLVYRFERIPSAIGTPVEAGSEVPSVLLDTTRRRGSWFMRDSLSLS